MAPASLRLDTRGLQTEFPRLRPGYSEIPSILKESRGQKRPFCAPLGPITVILSQTFGYWGSALCVCSDPDTELRRKRVSYILITNTQVQRGPLVLMGMFKPDLQAL